MRSKIRILSILFALGFIFALALNVGLLADDPPEWDCGDPTAKWSCCMDSQGRWGAWVESRSMSDTTLHCKCDGVPGWPTIGGPCNCQMDCYEFGNGQ